MSKTQTNFSNGSCFMALTQRLEFRQSQSLVMSPQLMQAIKLLQLSNLDLMTFVEEELECNPLLERASDDAAGAEAPTEVDQVSGDQLAEAQVRDARDGARTTYTEWGGGGSGDED
ncbi:DNA-directed RNA polymerase specialized sigma54-like protein [Bradyrhizobium diazoefficiens]